jgi:hypothetical protein
MQFYFPASLNLISVFSTYLEIDAMKKMISRFAVALTLCCGTSAFAGTVTIGDLTPGSPVQTNIDGFTGGVYADALQTFGQQGFATSATFNGNTTGNELTFMVGTFSGDQFTPTGIFNPITTNGGQQTVPLTLASGSSFVTSGETFGWTDQKIGSGTYNGGSIYYAGGTGSYDFFFADSSQNEHPIVVGSPVGTDTFGPRDYSVNVSITTTPEPASIVALVGLGGMGLIGLAIRRRRRRSA